MASERAPERGPFYDCCFSIHAVLTTISNRTPVARRAVEVATSVAKASVRVVNMLEVSIPSTITVSQTPIGIRNVLLNIRITASSWTISNPVIRPCRSDYFSIYGYNYGTSAQRIACKIPATVAAPMNSPEIDHFRDTLGVASACETSSNKANPIPVSKNSTNRHPNKDAHAK